MKYKYLILLLLLPILAGATTYYVRTDGSDANTGTVNDSTGAFLTPKYAWGKITDGDSIFVNEGEYLVGGGTTQGIFMNPARGVDWVGVGDVTFKADSTATFSVIYLRNSVQPTTFTNIDFDGDGISGSSIYIHGDASNNVFINCGITGGVSYNVNLGGESCVFDSCSFSGSPGVNVYATCNTTTLTNNEFDATPGTDMFYFYDCSGGTHTFQNNSVTSTSFGNLLHIRGSGDFIIDNNTITGNTGSSLFIYTEGVYSGNIDITNNDISTNMNSDVDFIRVQAGSWVVDISNNNINCLGILQDNGIIAIVNQPPASVTDNNITTESTSCPYHVKIGSGQAGPTVNIVRGNVLKSKSTGYYTILVGNDSSGAGNDTLNGTIISGNEVYGAVYYDSTAVTSTHGIFVGHQLNCIISDNYVNGSGFGGGIKHSGGVYTSGGIYNNVFINNYTYGAMSKGTNNVNISNNTIIQDIGVSTFRGIYIQDNESGGYPSGGNTIYNNIISADGEEITLIGIDALSSPEGYSLNNNCLYNSGSWKCSVSGSLITSISDWRTATSQAEKSIDTDPLLINEYETSKNSPCVSAGVTLANEYGYQIKAGTTFPDPDLEFNFSPWWIGAVSNRDFIYINNTNSGVIKIDNTNSGILSQ